jgi:two-component system nitrogen regulation response regulator GlnG
MAIILIADDEQNIRTILSHSLKKKNHQIITAKNGNEAYDILTSQSIDIGLIDIRMPGRTGLDLLNDKSEFLGEPSIFIMTAQDTMENTIEATKRGAFDYISKPFDLDEVITLIDQALSLKTKTAQVSISQSNTDIKNNKLQIIGKSKEIKEIYKTIGRISNQNITALIQGESGTGKELIAKVIHEQSNRSHQKFVAVNCSAIPNNLLESELFGYKKGAFTGALHHKIGYFEQANFGTIFLDEIGDMPLELQSKLLRVIQESEIQKLGDTTPHPIDVRIIAATNVNLAEKIKEGKFREDLFFRLNVIPINLPPLRERKADIPLLADFFLKKLSHELNQETKILTEDALNLLVSKPWMGNIRELENTLKRVAVLTPEKYLNQNHFKSESISSSSLTSIPNAKNLVELEKFLYQSIKENFKNKEISMEKNIYHEFLPLLERPLINIALESTKGNQIKASQLLGINRNTLRKKINELNINVEKEKYS